MFSDDQRMALEQFDQSGVEVLEESLAALEPLYKVVPDEQFKGMLGNVIEQINGRQERYHTACDQDSEEEGQ